MPSHAEEHFDAIGNYYHIIDPEGTLSEIERAKKEVEVLNGAEQLPKGSLLCNETFRIHERGTGL